MATTARRCAGCGSSLPETLLGTAQITCAFCGLVNDLTHAGGAAQQSPVRINVDVRGATQAAAKAGRTIAWVILLTVVLGIGAAVFGIYVAMKPVSTALTNVTAVTSQISDIKQQVAARNRKVTPEELAGLGQVGWRELNVPAPSSGWAAFEPVTDLGWAYAVARAWQKDARLTRIDVDRLKDNGTVDLTAGPDNTAGYRFVSPSQIQTWGRIADRDSKAEVGYELMIKMAEQKATALVVRGQPRSEAVPPPDVDSHPLPELLKLAKQGKGFSDLPYYNGYLINLEREGWVWYLNSLSRRESIPRVRARDGAVYPYRR
jgi:hypothetical protein